jgi:hypothetical protein
VKATEYARVYWGLRIAQKLVTTLGHLRKPIDAKYGKSRRCSLSNVRKPEASCSYTNGRTKGLLIAWRRPTNAVDDHPIAKRVLVALCMVRPRVVWCPRRNRRTRLSVQPIVPQVGRVLTPADHTVTTWRSLGVRACCSLAGGFLCSLWSATVCRPYYETSRAVCQLFILQ